MAFIDLKRYFDPALIDQADSALVQRVHFNNPQPFNEFLDDLETKHPEEFNKLTTTLDKLKQKGINNFNDVPPNIWLHIYNKSALAILRSDIEMRPPYQTKS